MNILRETKLEGVVVLFHPGAYERYFAVKICDILPK